MWWLRWQRFLWRHRVNHPLLRELYSTPLPSLASTLDAISFLVVDLETTSLDPNEGEIASIGWVPIDNGKVMLSGAEHHLIAVEHGVGQSAVFHQISDGQLSGASALEPVMRRFLERVRGRVLVFHYAGLDHGYLDVVTRRLFQAPLLMPFVDTMAIEKSKLLRHQESLAPGELRLFACRDRYGLPDYPPHNALVDAIATAELLLAQFASRGSGARLADIY